MKKKSILISAVVLVIALCSCSTMYIKPTIETVLYRQQIPGPAAVLFKAAQYIVPALGYKIDGSDPEAGTITTAPALMTVGQGDCDCGSSLGLPVIKSRGTKVKVSFILGVSSNELTIRSEITPVLDDLMSTLGAAANIVCVSKGGLEKAFAKQFMEKSAGNALRMLFK
jgi:hypothetical protein